MSITGKLIDVRFLVRGGLQAANQDLRPFLTVKPSWNLREQAKWWMVALALAGLGDLEPPFCYFYIPSWIKDFVTL